MKGGRAKQYLYGYVFFRQDKDVTIERGYLQKSVVLLTRSNFVKLYTNVIKIIGESYFQFGVSSLETALFNASKWPRPTLDGVIELPLLGKVVKFHVPPVRNGTFIYYPNNSVDEDGNFYTIDIYNTFKNFVQKLSTLWELVLLSEPILILSPNPTLSSNAVLSLVSLISPLEYQGDFRPYFTIHDQDFKSFSEEVSGKTKEGIMIGGTNPYFMKALEHWKHILILSDDKKKASEKKKKKSFMEYKNQLISNYKCLCNTDNSYYKKLKKLSGDTDIYKERENNLLIRDYFNKKTVEFLAPLEDYIDSLMPRDYMFSPFGSINFLKPFRESQFLSRLLEEKYPTNTIALYKEFIRTHNFLSWYRKLKMNYLNEIKTEYHTYLEHINVTEILKGRSEVEVIDLFLKAKAQLEGDFAFHIETQDIIKKYVQLILDHLPKDLQNSVKLGM